MYDDSRILMLSLRHIIMHVSRCFIYEFEDVIASIDKVDLISPLTTGILEKTVLQRVVHKTRMCFSKDDPSISLKAVKKDYDLFFFICSSVNDLEYLGSIPEWRARCAKAVCWIDEVWMRSAYNISIDDLGLIRRFDYIISPFYNTVKSLGDILGQPCLYIILPKNWTGS